MALTVLNKKNTGDIDFGEKKKPRNAAGDAYMKELDNVREQVEDNIARKQGKSAFKRVTKPTARLVMRNGEPVWIDLRN